MTTNTTATMASGTTVRATSVTGLADDPGAGSGATSVAVLSVVIAISPPLRVEATETADPSLGTARRMARWD